MASPFQHWHRAIILVDMNAFFASIEQLDQPEWRGQPVAVTNGAQGSCIITSSYEARAFGIKTGMRLYEAKRLCPGLIQAPARPRRYSAISRRIMTALEAITPDLEIFSVDGRHEFACCKTKEDARGRVMFADAVAKLEILVEHSAEG